MKMGDVFMRSAIISAIAIGCCSGLAQAQTSVTMYGSVDGGIRRLTNVDAAGNDRLSMGSNGTYNSNRIGFRGVEDLGGGFQGRFTLESGFNSGTGALDNTANLLFNRTATVGINSPWGGVDLGRQYNVPFKIVYFYDPLSYKYPSIETAPSATAGARFNNDIQYTGTFGATTVRAEYALGEVAGSTHTGSAKSVGANYLNGPWTLGGAYTLRDIGGFDNNHYTFGGAYNFGPAKVYAGFAKERQDTLRLDTTNRYAWIGAEYKLSTTVQLIGAHYQTKNSTAGLGGKKNFSIINVAYLLSVRTNLYAGVDKSRYEGTLIPTTRQTDQTGISVGVNHLF